MGVKRWWQKANAFHGGWVKVFNQEPSKRCVAFGLAVAQHETGCGDYWPGEYNWGAVQKRSLRVEETQVLYGLAPTPQNVTEARKRIRDANIVTQNEALHVDSSPGKGYYWIYFWAFPDDASAAAFFIKILAKDRAACRVVLASDVTTGLTIGDLAAEMYISGYYEGFHPGGRPLAQRKRPLLEAERANVADYTSALIRHHVEIWPALEAWTYGAVEPPYVPKDPMKINVGTAEGIQQALNYLGLYTSERLEEDGILGAKSKAAIRAFQAAKGLVPDGIPGPLTRAALKYTLGQS